MRTTPLIEQWELHARGSAFATGHPDFVLERAVRAGAVTADEAELIGWPRMEDEGLADAARRLGIGYTACRVRRAVAEERLARYLLVPGAEPGPGRPHLPSIGDLVDLADLTDLAEAA
ncbi:hypothetical protein ACFXJ5_18070 [Streptomyces sp. NPDC059373]